MYMCRKCLLVLMFSLFWSLTVHALDTVYIAMNVRKRMKDNFKSIVDMSYFARNSLKLNACSEHSIAVISSSSTVKVVQFFFMNF